MAELQIMRCEGSGGYDQISIQYNPDTLEAEKILWSRQVFNHTCSAVAALSEQYNLHADDFVLIDNNNLEHTLPSDLFLYVDEMGDLNTSNIGNYLRSR